MLQIDGFDIMIYTRDHEPRHVHVFRAEAEVIINIDDISVRANHGMKGKDVRKAQEIVADHQNYLQSE